MAKTTDMTIGSPARAILRFAAPLVGGYILQQMYLVIDAAIVGLRVGVGGLAAVGASTSILFLTMGFCNGSCAGFAIPVAQAFGAKDYEKMRRCVAAATRISIVLAVVATLFATAFCERILRVVNTPADVMDGAYTFLMYNFLSIPFAIAYNMLSGLIRALGDSRRPFYFLIASSVVNVALDVILIIGLGMGVAGAGLATMLSQALSAALSLAYVRRSLGILLPRRGEWRYDDRLTGRLLVCGIPMGLQFSITAIGSIMLQSANNALGTGYVASFTAAMRVKYLFTCVFENIGVAMATYCGQNIGAGQLRRVGAGIRAALGLSAAFIALTLAVIMPLADTMMLLFVDSRDTQIIADAALFLRIGCAFFPVLAVLTTLRYSIQGLGYANLSMLSGVMEMLARCGVSLWLVPAIGYLGVCYGDPVAWVMADLFLIPAMWLLYRHLRRRGEHAARQ